MATPTEPREFRAECPTCGTEHTFSRYREQMTTLIRWQANIMNELKRSLNWPRWIKEEED